jgi:TrmH family RNA methyltransferase
VVAQRGLQAVDVQSIVGRAGVTPLVMQDRLFDSLGTMPSPVPVLAVVTTPEPPLPASILQDTVVLDRVQDPGNVGAILRTAAAAGVQRVVTTPQTAWCWSPKVLRAAMGGHFALSIHESQPWERLHALIRIPVAGALAHGGVSIHAADLRTPCVWVFGNEGEGIAAEIDRRLDWRLTIPQADRVESLNVAAAAAICLFEQRRQRLAAAAVPAATGVPAG